MSRTAVVVQARVGSTRLPGKVLRELRGKTVLARVLGRCAAIPGVDAVVCATSTLAQDDPIASEALRAEAAVFRGSESDVLARYLGAARSVGADVVLRVTSDCPLIDPMVCRAVLDLRAEAEAEYAANNMPRLYPHGLDCEAFTVDALARANSATTVPFDREHVTPWLRRAPMLRRANLTGPGWPANMHRWTLDYPEDFDFFRAVFDRLDDPEHAGMQDVLSLLAVRPEITALNAMHRTPRADNTGTIVFRCDAGPGIGLGHAARCAALQDRLQPLGWACLWAVGPDTIAQLGIALLPQQTIRLDDPSPSAEAEAIRRAVSGRTILVIDRYGTEPEFVAACRDFAECILYFDDFGTGRLPADLTIAISEPPGEAIHAGRPRRLAGGRYAPLRAQFLAYRAASLRRRRAKPGLDRVLIAFGGTDTPNASAMAAAAVLKAGLRAAIAIGGQAPHLDALRGLVDQHGDALQLRPDAAEVAALGTVAELAVGAPGVGTWERATLGLPVLMVAIAENQRGNAAVVQAQGAGILCGTVGVETADQIVDRLTCELRALRLDPERLCTMAESAGALCDGRGVERIAVALLAETGLSDGRATWFRAVEPEDEALVLEWQRFPETRRYSPQPEPPGADEHHRWFSAKLQSPGDWFVIAETSRGPVGFIRLDWSGETGGFPIFIVSIVTAPGNYRLGVGRALLTAARRLAPRAILRARVLSENAASLALFTSLGYHPEDDDFLVSTVESNA